MGGSMGYGNMLEVVQSIDKIAMDAPFQLLVVCGNNADAKAEIEQFAPEAKHPVHAFGFVKNIPTFMDAADCLISKPGGLTTSEALAKGLPMIIVKPIPGQEERNAEFLLNAGCAMRVSKTCPIDECIFQLFSSKTRLDAMRLAVSAVGKPDSTERLGQFLVDLAHTPIISNEKLSSSDFAANPLFIGEDGYIIR